MTPCSTCPVLMLCGGGCAAGKIDDLTEGVCGETKEIWAEIAPRLLWKVRHEGLESLRECDNEAVKEADRTDGENISASLHVRSKYADNEECLSLSMREFLSDLTPDERKELMTTNNERRVFDILKPHGFFGDGAKQPEA